MHPCAETSLSLDLEEENAAFAAFWIQTTLSGMQWELLSPGARLAMQLFSSCVMLGESLSLSGLVFLICKMEIKKVSISLVL